MIAALLCVTLTIPFSSPAYNNIVWFPNCIHSSCWIRKFSGLLEFLYSRVWYLYLNSAVLNKKLISAGLRSFQLYFWWDCTTHRCCAAEPPTWIWVKLWDCWIARWEERWAGTSSSSTTGTGYTQLQREQRTGKQYSASQPAAAANNQNDSLNFSVLFKQTLQLWS